MEETHGTRIETAFTKQASTFEQPDLNLAFTSGLPWLLGLADAKQFDRVLDVAGGTGLVARALAPSVENVTVLDATDAMLTGGRAGAEADGLVNVEFVRGDAASLPFADGSFSLTITRFSLHHFVDPAPMLDEIVRVTAAGGRIVVKDVVSARNPEVAARTNHVERLRDDSHVRMPVEGMVRTWLEERGAQVEQVARKTIDRPLEPWLRQSVTAEEPAEAVRTLLRAEIEGGEPTGMRPHVEDGTLWFHQTWETTVGSLPR